MNYLYPNIQFLRAISVLLVFLYHLKIDMFKFGYIGVDIFFVISGFVISSRIYSELIEKKSIDLFSFYKKRFKRIFPVLIFILSFVFLFIIFFQPLDLLIENAYVFFFTIFGAANLYYLFSSKDYFDNIFEDVFGHTWSLGVEEQFYLIFPFLLLFIYKFLKGNKEFIKILSSLIIIGIFITVYFSENNQLIFYSPIFRFWELLLGSLVYILSLNFKIKNFKISLLAFIFLFSVSLNNSYMTNISAVVFSSLLASFFIFFYAKNNRLNFFFENSSLIFLGNISYSFYLWHLPVIYFFDLYFIESFFRIPFIFIVTFLLSIFTYFYIEKKFRYKEFKNISLKIITLFLISFIGIIYLTFYFSTQSSHKNDYKKKLKNIIYNINFLENSYGYSDRTNFYKISLNDKEVYKYCAETKKVYKLTLANLREDCLKKGKFNKRIFFIIGNSHTVNYIPAIDSVKMEKGDSIYFEHKAWTFELYDGLGESTLDSNLIKKINELDNHYNEVVFVTNIEPYNIDFLEDINLVLDKDIKILILSTIPNTDSNLNSLKCYIKRIDCKYLKSNDYKKRNLDFYFQKIRTIIDKNNQGRFLLYNSYDVICPNEICYSYNSNEDFLTHINDSHLTIEGSQSIKHDFLKFYKENLRYENIE